MEVTNWNSYCSTAGMSIRNLLHSVGTAHLHRRNFADLDGCLRRYHVSTCSCVTLHLPLLSAYTGAPSCCSGGPTRLRWACYEAAVRSLSRALPCERFTSYPAACARFCHSVKGSRSRKECLLAWQTRQRPAPHVRSHQQDGRQDRHRRHRRVWHLVLLVAMV